MRLTSFSSIKITSVLIMASLLSACGFHLRGDYSVPDELSTLSLTSYDQYSTFTRMMNAQLRLNEVNIVPAASNIPNLHILNEGVVERTLSLYQNTRAAEKELTFISNYRVTIPELGARTFSTSVTRSYLDNPLTALAKSVERDMIEDEMRKLATSQVVRQLARMRAAIAQQEVLAAEALENGENDERYRIETQEFDPNKIQQLDSSPQ